MIRCPAGATVAPSSQVLAFDLGLGSSGKEAQMEWLFGLEVVGGMLILRLVVPILIMSLLVHLLHRMEARWEASA